MNKTRRYIRRLTGALAIIMVLYVFAPMAVGAATPFEKIALKLKEYVFSDTTLDGEDSYTVFLTVSDGKNRANVVTGTSATLKKAWAAAQQKASDYVVSKKIKTVYLKADVVDYKEWKSISSLSDTLAKLSYKGFYRYGLSFDDKFKTAFLEAELNANKMLDYDSGKVLSVDYINKYLKSMGKKEIKEIPEKLLVFSAKGYIYDDGSCYTLNSEPSYNYGRRETDLMTREYAIDIMSSAVDFLVDSLNEDGSFIYGYYPMFDTRVSSYNILRHTGTIWTMLNQYELTGDETLRAKIDLAISYLEKSIVWKDKNTAFINEQKAGEIKIGGNGVALLALISYGEIYNTTKYVELCKALGNGILYVQDSKTGHYTHVLNYGIEGKEDFSKKADYRTVYYDGEATFGLCYLYSLTKNKKYLDGAQAAVEMFIREDYTQYYDHWVSYSINEITKHIPDERYFEFGLRNVMVNLPKINKQKTTYHTFTELLMSAFDLYDRVKTQGINVKYLEQFDEKYFIETIFKRVDYSLNGYFYPEYAIYMKKPAKIMGTFFVRHDKYRVRIDDVQHFCGGFYLFARDYDKVKAYYDELV